VEEQRRRGKKRKKMRKGDKRIREQGRRKAAKF
jgi:hypothetical protein